MSYCMLSPKYSINVSHSLFILEHCLPICTMEALVTPQRHSLPSSLVPLSSPVSWVNVLSSPSPGGSSRTKLELFLLQDLHSAWSGWLLIRTFATF